MNVNIDHAPTLRALLECLVKLPEDGRRFALTEIAFVPQRRRLQATLFPQGVVYDPPSAVHPLKAGAVEPELGSGPCGLRTAELEGGAADRGPLAARGRFGRGRGARASTNRSDDGRAQRVRNGRGGRNQRW